MIRRIIAAIAAIFVISSAFALSLQIQTIPPVVTPGTAGQIIFHITALPEGPGAKSIEMKITPPDAISVENADSWVDVGDALGGTVSYALHFAVADDATPGTYVIPVEIEYQDPATGQTFTEHFAPTITITEGKGLDVKMAMNQVYGETEMSIKFTVSNSGAPVYDARMIVPVAMGDQEIYLGDLGSGAEKSVYVDILPVCRGGVYTIPIILRGYTADGPLTQELNYTVKCYPPRNDLRVQMNIPSKITGGEQNTELTVTNLTSVATGPISILISGINVKLGGQTAYYVNSLPPQGKISVPVVWQLEKTDEQGVINVTVITPTGKRTYSYAVMPSTAPQIQVYPSSVQWKGDRLDVTLTVANIGTGTAETVFVAADKNATGNTVIGDLSPGDYDNADVYISPTGNRASFSVKVSYVVDGEKKTLEQNITVNVPPRPKSYGLWVLAAIVIIGAIWWWGKRR